MRHVQGRNSIILRVSEEEKLICKICEKKHKSKKALAGHVGAGHRMSMEQYVEKYIFQGKRPLCRICKEKTSWVRGEYGFKTYCINHANEGRKVSSREDYKNGVMGFNPGWKKGLTKETSESIKKQSEKMAGRCNPNSVSRYKWNKYRKEILEQFNIDVITTFSEYKNTFQLLDIVCRECGNRFERTLNHLKKGTVCRVCIPQGSRQEKEVVDSVKLWYEGEIRENSRQIIPPKELDIYIPNKNFAIEYNGLFWHSKRDKLYHFGKTISCKERGIQLFHIFSDEWENKKEIVESMIRYRLGKVDSRVYARKCEVKELNSKEARSFFEQTHIAGASGGFRKSFGLFYEGDLVCCLSLKKPIQKKYGHVIEIARFASELGTVVVGGFQKLFKVAKKWAKKEGFEGILTYADRRFGEGKVYEKAGFELVGETKIDYWYSDGKQRFSRFKFRAQKGKTEKEVALENRVFRVYGCGSNIYLLTT